REDGRCQEELRVREPEPEREDERQHDEIATLPALGERRRTVDREDAEEGFGGVLLQELRVRHGERIERDGGEREDSAERMCREAPPGAVRRPHGEAAERERNGTQHDLGVAET